MAYLELNGTMLQGFSWNLPPDGQHWRRLAQLANRLAEEGFTSVWMPPASKGTAGPKDVGYGVYDLWDLGEFDQRGSVATKYGTREEYQAAVKALREAGINVLADIVLNHRLGAEGTQRVLATEMAFDNRNYPLGKLRPISAWTRYEFPGRAGAYDDFTWDYHCFKAVDYDVSHERSGIFLLDGKHWDEDVDHENGNFDYLMGADVDLHDPRVYEQLVRWGSWFLNETGRNPAIIHHESPYSEEDAKTIDGSTRFALCYGDGDHTIPADDQRNAHEVLARTGRLFHHVCPGLGHGIDDGEIAALRSWLFDAKLFDADRA